MSRIRYVGGNNIKITTGKHLIHSEDSIEFSSLKKIYDSGDTNGTIHGNFKEREITEGDFIIDGEWLDKNGKPFDTNKTPHAKIGEEVYFRVKTRDIPINTPLRFEL